MVAKPLVADLPFEALADVVGGTGRAALVWEHLRHGDDPLAAGVLTARWRTALVEHCSPCRTHVAHSTRADCGTIKAAVQLADGAVIETVVIPRRDHSTVCVSSQVGCGRGCVFCATATMGRQRNLSAGEILMQVGIAQRLIAEARLPTLRNVVFMGMGEPLDNFAAVATSVRTLIHPSAWALAPRQVTVSTVGPSVTAVRKLAQLPVSIAWSLHAADPALRRRLVPHVRADLHALRSAFADALSKRTLFVEVTLLHEVNDTLVRAQELGDFLAPFSPRVRVNLLPMNTVAMLAGRGSSPERVAAFQAVLRERDIFCAVRHARGTRIAAACGQLVSQGFSGRVSSAGNSNGVSA